MCGIHLFLVHVIVSNYRERKKSVSVSVGSDLVSVLVLATNLRLLKFNYKIYEVHD